MDARHKQALTRNHVLLVEEMVVDETFLAHMTQDCILIPSHVEEITAKNTKAERAGEFLRILIRRGPRAMQSLIQALLRTHQDHIADTVEPGLAAMVRSQMGTQAPSRPIGHSGHTVIAQETSRRPEPEEPEPNLNEEDTDSFIDINVRKVDVTSPDFIKKLNDKHVYDVKRAMRGRAIIINNELFHNERHNRSGTNYDMINLDGLLTALGYKTTVHSDKTAKEMVEIIAKESRHPDHAAADSFVLALFSHGARGVVYGTDFKPVNVEEVIMAAFDGKRCPQLAGKPKLIIIQACQGKASTEGVPVADAAEEEGTEDELSLTHALERLRMGDGDVQDAVPWSVGGGGGGGVTAWGEGSAGGGEMGRGEGRVVQEKGDMLVAYSTVSGYKSWRLPDRGSWFIRTLVKVFMYYAKTDHVIELLTRVRDVVSQKKTNYSVGGLNVQMTKNDDTLTKKWFLFPGYTPPATQ